jgi:serine/threonine protein kinase
MQVPPTLSPYQLDNKSVTTISAISTKVNGKKLINQYVIIQIIGKGKFSKVAQCMDQSTRQIYAMKVMKKSRLKRIMIGRGKAAYSQVEAEIAILKKLNHPNIVKLYEIIDDPKHDKLYLITEYIKNGTLQSKINTKPLPVGPNGYSPGLTED